MDTPFVRKDPSVESKRPNGNTRPLPLAFPLAQCGRLRVGHLLTVFGISAPEFYARLKNGLIPAPDGRDPRPYWESQTIIAFKADHAINCAGSKK